MSGYTLDVQVLFGAVDTRRLQLGLSLVEVAAQARVPADVLSAMAAGEVPSAHDCGSLLLWLGWEPDMARLVVGDAA